MFKGSAEEDRKLINNTYYDGLGQDWHSKANDPIALLRAETHVKVQWALDRLPSPANSVGLDVGCGAGFAVLPLAKAGARMVGLDYSLPTVQTAVAAAQAQGLSEKATFVQGDAYDLPFSDEEFDFVICFDFLEHVSRPLEVVKECSRVLKPNGLFLYHTFNRNFLSRLVVIKGLEWFVKNTPEDLHVYRYFIKPSEMVKACRDSGLTVKDQTGIRPVLDKEFWRLLSTGKVSPDFKFTETKSKTISYMGCAQKALI